jgi:hypothetical protein
MFVLTVQKGWESYFFKVVGDPQRDRGAPIAVARNRPVACIGEPVSESILTDVWRHPVKRRAFRTFWASVNKNNNEPSSLAVVLHKVIDGM